MQQCTWWESVTWLSIRLCACALCRPAEERGNGLLSLCRAGRRRSCRGNKEIWRLLCRRRASGKHRRRRKRRRDCCRSHSLRQHHASHGVRRIGLWPKRRLLDDACPCRSVKCCDSRQVWEGAPQDCSDGPAWERRHWRPLPPPNVRVGRCPQPRRRCIGLEGHGLLYGDGHSPIRSEGLPHVIVAYA